MNIDTRREIHLRLACILMENEEIIESLRNDEAVGTLANPYWHKELYYCDSLDIFCGEYIIMEDGYTYKISGGIHDSVLLEKQW